MHPVTGFVVKLSLLALAGSPIQGETASTLHARAAFERSQDETSSEIARLSRQLNSPDEEERRHAVLTLATLDTPAARDPLIAALADRAERVRAAAITGLSKFNDPQTAIVIAPLATNDKSAFVRKTAAYGLGHLRSPAGTAALVAALKDKQTEVRGAAAVALGEYADAQAIDPLINALSDKSEFVRAHAARALGTNGRAAGRAVSDLIRLLTSDLEQEAKRQAAWALGQIGDPAALPALEAAYRGKDPHLSSIALAAIERIKNRE